jgi:hypothetical protein
MAYNRFNLVDLKDLVKERFYRKNLEREARGIKYNKSANAYRQILEEADRNPIVSNKVFLERQREQRDRLEQRQRWEIDRQNKIRQQEIRRNIGEQVRQMKINKLRSSIELHPVQSFNELEEMGYKFTHEDVDRLFRNVRGKYTVKLTFDDGRKKEITITRENIDKLRNMLVDRMITYGVNVMDSDSLEEFDGLFISKMKLKEYKQSSNVRRHNGFFPYFNQTNIDLTKYQIYKSNDLREDENECCLLYTLRKNGINTEKLKEVVAFMGALQTNIPLSKMEDVAKIIEHKIVMNYFDEKFQRIRRGSGKNHVYGQQFEKTIEISQYKNHIFFYEEVPYTKFYINNMNEIEEYCKLQEVQNKYLLTEKNKKYFRSKNPKFISSLELIVNLMENNKFSEYHVDLTTKASNNYVIEPSLSNLEINQSPFVNHNFQIQKLMDTTQKDKEVIYLFGDCESDVVSSKTHEMIAFGYMDMEGKYNQIIYSENFQSDIKKSMIKTLRSKGLVYSSDGQNMDVVIFFHNVKYDSNLFDGLFYPCNEVEKDGQIYSRTYYFDYGLKVEFRDSLKHFGGKLSDATETFGLEASKGEAIGYTYHTKYNIQQHNLTSSKEYRQHVKPEEQAIFLENIKTDLFDANKYYLEYLKQDVNILRQAMLKYRDLIFQITKMDAFEFLTISSIGYNYACGEGCFEGLYRVKGCLREFIQRAIKGGRVYVNPEYEKQEIDEKIEDFDGVSLYPSSMKRLCDEYGLPMGEIKKGFEQNYQYYESKDWYIVKILLTKISKQIQIPCVSNKTKEGNLQYINEIQEPVELYVDKTTLNDYIKFQDIEYTIIEGVYWDEGFNKKLGEVITNLHNERCKYKKTNEPLATMIKLIMNSIYGKTGQRIGETKTIFKSNEQADKYIYDHFGTISLIEKNDFNTKITERICDDSFSLNYVACSILSMSKRIMNEVFSVMDDNKQPVYYTDTDSIHMLQKDVDMLGEKYKEKYGRELIGDNLGQFHTDFKMKGCKNIFSIKHIPISTKTYLDILQGTNKKGETVYGTHIRIKAITKAGIDFELMSRGPDRVESAISLFRDLKDEKEVCFYLNPTDHNVRFEFNSSGVSTRKTKSFVRILNKQKKKLI